MSTMLVPLAPRSGGQGLRPAIRPLAGFVAQVIACREGLPDHRPRRMRGAEEASALYQARQEGGDRAWPLAERRI